jgi:perosamine synthetase
MTGYQAAMGLAQVRRIEKIIENKRRVARSYSRSLAGIPGIQLPTEAEWARNVYWMYALVIKPEFGKSRDELMRWLEERGIETRTFFCPMNQQPCLEKEPGFRPVPCPVAENLWKTGLYLPSTYTLSEEDIIKISDTVRAAAMGPETRVR